jgi:rubrerythrin
MGMSFPATETATSDLAKIIEGMGMTHVEVRKEARISAEVLREAIAGAVPDRNIQLKLEAVLDQPIWSTEGQFYQRRKVRQFFGCEPLLLNTDQILARVRQLGVNVERGSKANLIAAIAEKVQGTKVLLNDGRLWRCRSCKHVFQAAAEYCPRCFKLSVCRVA